MRQELKKKKEDDTRFKREVLQSAAAQQAAVAQQQGQQQQPMDVESKDEAAPAQPDVSQQQHSPYLNMHLMFLSLSPLSGER
jgi:hypothetical protein